METAIEKARALPAERLDLFIAVDIAVMMSYSLARESQLADAEETADRVCIGCGCTEERACPNGCSWASYNPPVCIACTFADRVFEDLLDGSLTIRRSDAPPVPLEDLFIEVGGLELGRRR